MHYEHTIVVDRPPATVYAYMDDVDREREWQTALVEATQEPPGDTVPGTRKRYVSEFLGKRVENVWVAREVEPGRKVVYETTPTSTMRAVVTVSWTPTPTGGTSVTMSVDGTPTGALRFVPRRLLEATSKRELERALETLKARLEHGPG